MMYLEPVIGTFKEWIVSERVTRNDIEKRRCIRHRDVSKPRLTERIRKIWNQWKEAHHFWSNDDWSRILRTDET